MAKRKQSDPESAPAKKAKRSFDSKESTWSKSKKKRMRRLKAKQKKRELGGDAAVVTKDKKDLVTKETAEAVVEEEQQQPSGVATKETALQKSFRERLTGSRFRELNEELYTTTSSCAFERFSNNPELFQQYHDGFRHQVKEWPVNPVNVIYKWLVTNFRKQAPCVVADFGCGDAALAKKLLQASYKNKCPFQVHSFDLVANNNLVTACDMAHTPLDDSSVTVAVFCLSLMGTNLADFVREAHRVLTDKGILKIAEVRSRFESTSQKNELDDFVQVLDKLGFKVCKTDRSNKMFVVLECKKNGKKPQAKLNYTAKPCIYKRR